MGELCSGGVLSYPSLRRDVHSGHLLLLATLCPSRKQDKPLTLSSAKDWRAGEGFCFEPGMTDPLSLSISLSLALPPYLLSVFFRLASLSPYIASPLRHTLCMTCGHWGARSQQS
ncbi:hypothetical protein SKAU_G00226770 [Synaphobranchus kaupii]|uniref:Uncharacterized protein n=1 Tax=Synaphobranchus kaupii TaxID=118154 RepID=A0A9Q1F5A2_SYNKA|nr:hypothetical protein SKAU_G00226770 [Synaphobranchus kaupii]